jgi:hypothetical protein
VLDGIFRFVENYADVFLGLTLLSVVMVIVMLTVGARVLADLPEDYFINDKARRQRLYLKRFPVPIRFVIPVARNLLGGIFVLAGIVMLVLPGQGLLTVLAGVVLLDFPGKFECERWLVRKRQVRRTIDWLRRRAGHVPFKL